MSESISATALSFLRMDFGGTMVVSLVYQPSNMDKRLESSVRLRLRCSVERILSRAREAEVTPVELRL